MRVHGKDLQRGDVIGGTVRVISAPEDDTHLPGGHLWVTLSDGNGDERRVITRAYQEHWVTERNGVAL